MGYQIVEKSLKMTEPLCGCPIDKCCCLVGRGAKGANVLKADPVVSICEMVKRLSKKSVVAALTSFSIFYHPTVKAWHALSSNGNKWEQK